MHKLASALLITLMVVSACGGSNGDAKTIKLSQPKPGQCIAGEVPDGSDVAPDTQTVVPCNKDHAYEIVAVIDIPDELLAGKTDKEKLARRTAFADVDAKDSELRKKLGAKVGTRCDEAYRAAAGLDKLTVNGKSAKEVSLRTPGGNASHWYTITSPDLWLSGTTQAVCSYRFTAVAPKDDENPPVAPVKSADAKPVMASYLTKDYPVSLRSCQADDEPSSCTELHQREPLWIIDMKAVYGKGFLSGANLKDVNSDQFAKITKACSDVYTQTGGTISATTEMGFSYFTGAPTTGKTLSIVCNLASKSNVGFRNFAAYQ